MVPGEGPQPSAGMIVGEAPGRKEVELGRPFVGKSGALLDIALQRLGIARSTIYVTNVVKEMPVDSLDRIRRPYDHEILYWLSTLKDEIDATSPVALLALGKTAAATLEGASVPVFHAWHPAYLLYTGKAHDDDGCDEWIAQLRPWAEEVVGGAL